MLKGGGVHTETGNS